MTKHLLSLAEYLKTDNSHQPLFQGKHSRNAKRIFRLPER